MKIYHQCGHNTNWNIDSFQKDKVGNGLILSPVHSSAEQVAKIPQDLKKTSLFDPQFYVPDSQKTKLNSYDFFPERVMEGFSTRDYEAFSAKVAGMCVDYQVENNFESMIIPARYHDDMLTDFIDRQSKFSLDPFLARISDIRCQKPVFMTLPLTDGMLNDEGYRTKLLNWISGYSEIDGVYLLANLNERSKQICDVTKLKNYIQFAQDLIGADLDVLCGYCNTEGLLFSALDIYGITIGAYENTRRFSIDKFLEDDSETRGPAPRIYMPKLLNWIRYDTAIEIREDFSDLWNMIYEPTTYSEAVIGRGTKPHFSQPDLYKHHFICISHQYATISGIKSAKDRLECLSKMIQDAHRFYELIGHEKIMFFDDNCSGGHLPAWNRIVRGMIKGI